MQLAENFAAQQITLGIKPLGLDPSYPGLHDVSREGDPQANLETDNIDLQSQHVFGKIIHLD